MTAFAQEGNCPPGAWFCEEVDTPRDPAPAEPPAADPDNAPEALPPPAPPPPPAAPPPPGKPAARSGVPPVVIYQTSPASPPPQIVIVTPGAAPPPRVIVRQVQPVVPLPPAAPPPPKRRWRREWGLNFRLEGASFGRQRGAAEEAGMGGVGLSLRYRPVPAFAIDAGVDVISGKDYHGYERTEVPLSLNGMVFFNPRSRVQFYMMGGVHVSHAEVEVPDSGKPTNEYDFTPNTEYDYFGGQGGIGLELRLSRRIALNVDAIGFIRERTDEGTTPEFRDPDTGRTTNSSGGGLFRGGLTVYW